MTADKAMRFQPTLPLGERPNRRSPLSKVQLFLPTLLLRGAAHVVAGAVVLPVASTLAPLAGSDPPAT